MNPIWAVFFAVFIMGLHYGLLNLVVAIIVESTMETAKGQEETMKKLEDQERWANTKALKKVYEGIDGDGVNQQEPIMIKNEEDALDLKKTCT